MDTQLNLMNMFMQLARLDPNMLNVTEGEGSGRFLSIYNGLMGAEGGLSRTFYR